MCDSPHERLGPPALIANLRQPGPLSWKLQRFVANVGYKITHGKRCCGHPGEPGC